jgi:hypothetical protein
MTSNEYVCAMWGFLLGVFLAALLRHAPMPWYLQALGIACLAYLPVRFGWPRGKK